MAVTGGLMPQSRISGSRAEGFRRAEKDGDFQAMFADGQGLGYLAQNGIRALKYEDPGKDDFVLELLEAAPQAVFVASYRSIERVIESHHNITRWGHSEADVLHQFSACLTLYEKIADRGRLFLVDVDDRESFDLDASTRFLGVDAVPGKARDGVAGWQPVNDLQYQVEKTGTFHGRVTPPRLERLREIHDWIEGHEARYADLIRGSRPADAGQRSSGADRGSSLSGWGRRLRRTPARGRQR